MELIKELSQNFIEYAASVNSDRAIPDAKSGLKPVARRILYGAYNSGYTSNKKYVKNARIVSDVMGLYHPHGDSSIYGALVRLSQPWVMRYPLIDFHGNQGSINGDGPAAYRYTEGRLAPLAEVGMLQGMKKNNVDFIPNYDESTEEPITLPAVFPNLLCNPNTGIGVAMAASWAPHNLNEVAEAIYAYIDGKELPIVAPDFPTGGIIINQNDLPKIMQTGRGTVKIRAKYETKGDTIFITEIPYGTTIESLLDEIAEVCNDKVVEGISEVQDRSNKHGIQIVIKCQKTANPDFIMEKLFAKTGLQSHFSYNQVALVDKTPTELNLRGCIEIYVNHNIDCLKRTTQYDLQKAIDRLHIVDGLLIALEDIDNIIALIKASTNSSAAKDALIQRYGLSEVQAKSILAMRLSSLAKMEKVEIENEKSELVNTCSELEKLLSNKELQLDTLKKNLNDIVKKFGDCRRTSLTQIDIVKEKKEKPEFVPEDCVVVATSSGLVKRVPLKAYKTQKRNTAGIKSQDEAVVFSTKTNTGDYLMAFGAGGKMYKIMVNNIPEGTNATRGASLFTLLNLDKPERFITYTTAALSKENQYVLFNTKLGLIKRVPMEEYSKTKKTTGIIALNMNDGDELADVNIIEENQQIIVITQNGMSIKFNSSDLPVASRIAKGVKSINLATGDTIKCCVPVQQDGMVVIATTSGHAKKLKATDFPLQKRAGKGTSCSPSEVAGACWTTDGDAILVVGDKGIGAFESADLPTSTRSALGNITLKNNKISTIGRI